MKIAVIRSECSFAKGGAERYAANLCRTLAGMGHHVWVLAEKMDDSIHPALVHVPVHANRSSSWSRNNSYHRNSQIALENLDPDAVLALSRSFPADAFRVSDPLHRYWMEIRYPGKVHRFLQSLNPRHRAILNLEKAILDPAHTRMILTNSQLSKKIIREYYQYPADRIHVVYNGVDHLQFSPAKRPPARAGTPRLLFVGQDFKRKGLSPLIEALSEVKRAGCDFTLMVIGTDNPAAYKRKAQRAGIGGNIIFKGPTFQIQNAYLDADLFVFPTLYDPFANVCLEALACGLPVLTTSTNGASEVITKGSDGYVVPGDPATLASSLAEKISAFCRLTVTQRETMSQAARAKAARFTIEANASAIIALLSGKDTPS